MQKLPVSVVIARTIAFVAVAAIGGWLGYLAGDAYWAWRSETEITDPLMVSVSLGISTIAGALLAVWGLSAIYDRPIRRARKQEQLRLGPSRLHRSRV